MIKQTFLHKKNNKQIFMLPDIRFTRLEKQNIQLQHLFITTNFLASLLGSLLLIL